MRRFCLFSLLALGADAGAALGIPAGAPPKLDGRLEDAEWKGAARLEQGGLVLHLKHDGKALYVGVTCPEPFRGSEELYLLLDTDAGGGATPASDDLQFSFNPFSLLRLPWEESRGDGKSWTKVPSPSGWTAEASPGPGGRFQAEFAASLGRLGPGESPRARLGVLVSGDRRFLAPEGLNLYTPDSWLEMNLEGGVAADPAARGSPELFSKLEERLAKAQAAREAFRAVQARDAELSKRTEPPKTQAEALALQQAAEAVVLGLEKAVDLEPGNPFLHFGRASAKVNYFGDFDGALEDFEAACKALPGESRMILRLAEAYQMSNRHAEAVTVVDALLDLEPGQPRGYLLRGQLRQALGSFDAAVDDFRKVGTFPIDAKNGRMVDALLEQALALQKAWPEELQARKRDEAKGDLPRVEIQTGRGKILLELFEDDAPNTVANFLSLVQARFYDGIRFHSAVPGQVIQGGDPYSRNPEDPRMGRGGPGYRIPTQTSARRHWRGVITMARAELDTDGSQFFLTIQPLPHLDGKYAVFGRVLEGQDVVDKLRPGDLITGIQIARKRDHPYVPEKLEGAPPAK